MAEPSSSPITITPRLLLIRPDPSSSNHADFIVNLYNTPQFIASIGGKPTSITTREAAARYIKRRFASEHKRNGYGTYIIVLKPDVQLEASNNSNNSNSNKGPSTASKDEVQKEALQQQDGILIGTVSLSRGEGVVGEKCYAAPDLGFAVLPEYCRKGIATEASRGLLDWARRERGVDIVLGLHDPANVASAGVLQKLGFERRGERKLAAIGVDAGLVWTLRTGHGEDDDKGAVASYSVSEEEIVALGVPGLSEE